MKAGESCRLLATMVTDEGAGVGLLSEARSLSSALTKLLRAADPQEKVRTQLWRREGTTGAE